MKKIRKILGILTAAAFGIGTISLITLVSLKKETLVIGNFHSYMSNNVKETLRKKYNASYDYYGSNETIKLNLINNQFDVFVPSTYELVNLVREGLVMKLDWNTLNIPSITDAKQALSLFTQPTQEILMGFDLNKDGHITDEDNLLNYCIPYFMQDLIFMYRGIEIPELSDPDITWDEALNIIGKQDRFNPSKINWNYPSLGAISDARTLYSIPRLTQTKNNVNPPNDASINNLDQTYNRLLSKLENIPNNKLFLSEDSNVLLNKIAKGELLGSILYNGDAAFASQGGDEEIEIPESDMHIVRPKYTLHALDVVAISNGIKSKYINDAYGVLKDLTLLPQLSEESSPDYSQKFEETIVFQNFNYVMYTPTLRKLYDYVIAKINNSDYYLNNDLLSKIMKIPTTTNQNSTKEAKIFEDPLNKLVKSNFRIAFINFKNKLV